MRTKCVFGSPPERCSDSHCRAEAKPTGVCTADWHTSLSLDLAVLQMLNGVKPERETWSSAACHRRHCTLSATRRTEGAGGAAARPECNLRIAGYATQGRR